MRVAIYGLKVSEKQKSLFENFFEELKKRGVDYTVESKFQSLLTDKLSIDLGRHETYTSYDNLQDPTDLMFTFGGDGTILNAATIIKDRNIPIVGVNTGRLGFLASLNIELLAQNLDDVFSKNYSVSKRSIIHVHSDEVEIEFPFALNEITVTRRETTSMITVDAYVNGEFLNSYWADGLIVSTPTGSTGYSLSCGGPIVHPDNQSFIITAIAPHNLNVRPYMIPDNVVIDMKVHSRANEYFLSLDGRNLALSTKAELRLKKADFKINVVELRNKTYIMTIRDKMFWGSDKRN